MHSILLLCDFLYANACWWWVDLSEEGRFLQKTGENTAYFMLCVNDAKILTGKTAIQIQIRKEPEDEVPVPPEA